MGSIHLLAFSAWACSLAFVSLGVPFLAICRAFLDILRSFFGFVLRPSDSVDFSYSKGLFLIFLSLFCVGLLLPHFSSFWFCSF